jgi:hypothetical protein
MCDISINEQVLAIMMERSSRFRGFTITLRHTTRGWTPLDEWSAWRRDFYLTTHNTRKRFVLSTTNKMQRYTTSFILSVLYMFRAVFPLIIRSSKTVHAASGISQTCLVRPLAWVSRRFTHASRRIKQVWLVPGAACTVFELLMMSGKTALNM